MVNPVCQIDINCNFVILELYLFENNTAQTGGAIVNDVNSTIYMNDVSFSSNTAIGRDDKYGGGAIANKGKIIMMKDSSLFKDLVLAINPKIIICLGKLTFECVVQKKVAKWLKTLKEEGTPFFELYPDDPKIRVYGVAHCGAWGIRNIGGEENMIRIWEKMKSLEIRNRSL